MKRVSRPETREAREEVVATAFQRVCRQLPRLARKIVLVATVFSLVAAAGCAVARDENGNVIGGTLNLGLIQMSAGTGPAVESNSMRFVETPEGDIVPEGYDGPRDTSHFNGNSSSGVYGPIVTFDGVNVEGGSYHSYGGNSYRHYSFP